MDQPRWEKIEPIIDAALRIDHPSNRKIYIEKACRNDSLLYQEVTSLLAAIQEAEESNFMEQ
ncbi:hypothetical protein [Fodinibius sp. AD559]|uniref:hypothetical protein n=1 Tax=Fodinibius sp. AD559 TaxID=3424179 RepID=UPI0040470130